jgi:hypothetical protein
MTHLTKERLKAALHWIGTCPNAPKHFTKHGNEINRETITQALQTLIDAKTAPTGWKLVPIEPNGIMLKAMSLLGLMVLKNNRSVQE